ncbi:rifin PIR protein, putative [Plasmodium reichenowi]|uniref:Rifin PIR protein, putative n=1 Tax=Plasmodium reichenowi TaxID=5854 RepID=A0A2P9DSC8_PLARE|nr:rifin PIR protein, putative [Plasmodium reichenowi]
MKVNYINILLFVVPLNILVNKHIKPHTTPHTKPNRSLCECELYSPANYDNDQEMKRVMENFNRQTSQRFHEYDDRMVEKRKHCKDKCDKEIQKIILKDKLEKQMAEQFATLQTDIQRDAIPTCVCEKSLADKVEKFCLNCGVNVGGGVTLSSGVLGGISEALISAWKPKALEAAIAAAKDAAAAEIAAAANAAGIKAGKELVIAELEEMGVDMLVHGICEKISSAKHYNHVTTFTQTIINQRQAMCGASGSKLPVNMCTQINTSLGTMGRNGELGLPDSLAIPQKLTELVTEAKGAADGAAKIATDNAIAGITKKQTALIEGGFNSTITSIYAAIIAIVVIVLIMVIIYKILRYRRKKKMKKKLQYIKLLDE